MLVNIQVLGLSTLVSSGLSDSLKGCCKRTGGVELWRNLVRGEMREVLELKKNLKKMHRRGGKTLEQ